MNAKTTWAILGLIAIIIIIIIIAQPKKDALMIDESADVTTETNLDGEAAMEGEAMPQEEQAVVPTESTEPANPDFPRTGFEPAE